MPLSKQCGGSPQTDTLGGMCDCNELFDDSLRKYHKAARAAQTNLREIKDDLDAHYKVGEIKVKKKVLQVELHQRHNGEFVGWLRVPRPSN